MSPSKTTRPKPKLQEGQEIKVPLGAGYERIMAADLTVLLETLLTGLNIANKRMGSVERWSWELCIPSPDRVDIDNKAHLILRLSGNGGDGGGQVK
jgi:hypothetical protein